jgi:hypothetical protein
MKRTLAARTGAMALIYMAAIIGAAENPDVKVTQSGFGSLEAGQLVKGMGSLSELEHVWIQKMYLQLTTEAIVKERMRVVLSGEGQMSWSYPQDKSKPETERTQFSYYFNEVSGVYSFGDLQFPFLQFGVGYFPFKYNPDARNLGEYLFGRTGSYGQYILTSFDFPFSRLLGLRLTSRLFHDHLRQDLLLTSETDMYPMMDYSASYLLSVKAPKLAEFAAGVSASHLLSIDKRNTDHVDDPVIRYVNENGDTAYYNFRGVKAMARAALDFKSIMPASIAEKMGNDELRLYGEIGVLGLKNIVNYGTVTRDTTIDSAGIMVPRTDTVAAPGYFDTLWQRVPVMFGISLPTFKILDVLSVEFEWYGSRFQNNYLNYITANRPLPYDDILSGKSTPWKWSVYAKKTLAPGFAITAQAANDHMRVQSADASAQNKGEALRKKGNWWYVLKFMFGF